VDVEQLRPDRGPLDAAVLHPSCAAVENEHTMVIHLNTTPRGLNPLLAGG
jgi:hypothetical protein